MVSEAGNSLAKIFVALAFALLLSNSGAQAQAITTVISFGDSLTDTGNTWRNTKNKLRLGVSRQPDDSIYLKGRFTNGPVWTEYLSEKLNAHSQNFAYAGALSGRSKPFKHHWVEISGMAYQVEEFIAANNQPKDRKKALVTIWIGGNDFEMQTKNRAGDGSERRASGIAGSVANNIRAVLHTLVVYGYRNFLINTLPDIGKTPLMRDNARYDRTAFEDLSRASDILNEEIKEIAKGNDPRLKDTKIVVFNVSSLFSDMIANRQNYGLTNSNKACYAQSTSANAYARGEVRATGECGTKSSDILEKAKTTLFYDGFHPTTAVHRVIGLNAMMTWKMASDERVDVIGSFYADPTVDSSFRGAMVCAPPKQYSFKSPDYLNNPYYSYTNDNCRVEKRGSKTLNFKNVVAIDELFVRGGTLVVDGNLMSNRVLVVGSGATLAGNGWIRTEKLVVCNGGKVRVQQQITNRKSEAVSSVIDESLCAKATPIN